VIIGARKQSQLDDHLQAVDVALTADDLKPLGEVSAPVRISAVDGFARIGSASGERRY
jgi:aryl-alcohol dehydrogenase-like predicted oxidoreductase